MSDSSPAQPETAQDAFRILMKEHIAPVLHVMGYSGSSSRYHMKDATSDNFGYIEFSKSRYSTKDEVYMNFNVEVWNTHILLEVRRREGRKLNLRPTSHDQQASMPLMGLRLYMHNTLPRRIEGWTVRPGDDLDALAKDIVRDVATIHPRFVAMLATDAQVADLVDITKKYPHNLHHTLALSLIIGHDHPYRKELASLLQKQLAEFATTTNSDPDIRKTVFYYAPEHVEAFLHDKPWPYEDYTREREKYYAHLETLRRD